jgi:hypothetical protein
MNADEKALSTPTVNLQKYNNTETTPRVYDLANLNPSTE